MFSAGVRSRVVDLLWLSHCLLLLPLPVWVSCLILVFAMQCHFFFCNHLAKEGRASYFALIVFMLSCDCWCCVIFLAVLWVSLQCVIVAFPYQTDFFRMFSLHLMKYNGIHPKTLFGF